MKKTYYAYILIVSALTGISCHQPDTVHITTNDYRAQGDSIIKATFDTLRNALTSAIHNKGVQGAVAYCNENAYPITAALASENISIKRVAEKYRNPQNAPDSTDAIQWKIFVTAKANGDSLQPTIITNKNTVHYYKPMLLQPMCSACHGKKGVDILPEVVSTIDSLYPNDKATGFTAGDLRGMWKISFVQK